MQYTSLSPFLPCIENSKQFHSMRHEIMSQLTPRQSQVQMRAATANIDNDETDDDVAKTESISSTAITTTERNQIDYKNRLFIHYKHEKRFQSMKRDMHQVYDNVFKNTSVMDVRLFVGNRNGPDAKKELVRKKTKTSNITTYINQKQILKVHR